jgi:hypothetical protein
MSTESSEQARKKVPWTESVPLYAAFALSAVIVLFFIGVAFLGKSDETLRDNLLGKWEAVSKEGDSLRWEFHSDGRLITEQDNIGVYENTWAVQEGRLVLRVKQGGNIISDLELLMRRLSYGREKVNAPSHLRFRLVGDSELQVPDLGLTFRRLGL